MNVSFIATEARAGLRRNHTMTLAAIVTIVVSLTLLGLALIIRNGTDKTKFDLLSTIEVSVFLDSPCGSPGAPATNCLSPTEQISIQRTLQSLPQVQGVQFVSQTDAYQRFKRLYSDEPALVKETPPSALPASFAVKLFNPKNFAVVNSAVSRAPGVSSVQDSSQTLKKLFSFFDRVSLFVLVVALILIGATCLLIYNAMRVAAFTRRRETGIMRLVGASDISIQAPFVLEGLVIGVIGSAVAVLALLGLRAGIHSTVSTAALVAFGEWSTLTQALPVVIAIGILLPAIASFLTLQRHLRV